MRFIKILTLLMIAPALLIGGCAGRADPPSMRVEMVAAGFTSPVFLIAPPDGSGRLFVVDQVGLVWVISEGQRLPTPFLDLRARLVQLNSFYDERGLLGLAFHPDFAINGRFYVSYSAPLQDGLRSDRWDHTTHISEFTVSAADSNSANPTSERVLLAIDKPGYNHEAGHLAFGPEGYLYVATGDSVHDPAREAGGSARDTGSLLGKILRIDVNGTAGAGQNYLIPPDNPFAEGGGRAEVYAYGFRNPYRFSFDVTEARTRLFVADVGQAHMEEVSLVEAGGDYGWPVREGTSCFNEQVWNEPLEFCPGSGLMNPIIAYAHRGNLSAIIGGAVYGGRALPELDGKYLFGDWGRGDGRLFAASPPLLGRGSWKIAEIQIRYAAGRSGLGELLGIGVDGNKELYLLTKDSGAGPTGLSGKVYRLVR